MKYELGKILFCNIAEMKEYKGNLKNDPPYSKTKYYKKHKYVFELYNFLNRRNGNIYGFVQPGGKKKGFFERKVNLKRIVPHTADIDKEIKDVLVIFVALKKGVTGHYIVGWYKNATIFRYFQDIDLVPGNHRKTHKYNLKIHSKNNYLIPAEERQHKTEVKFGQGGGIVYSYEDNGKAKRKEVLDNMRRDVQYINNYK